MQGNIKIAKSTEWAYTIMVKKFSIEQYCKTRNIVFSKINQNEIFGNYAYFYLKLYASTKKVTKM